MADRTLSTTVEIDGTEHEVNVPLPDGYAGPEELKDMAPRSTIKSEIDRRVSSIRSNLLTDEDFRSEALDAWGVDPNANDGEPAPKVEERLQQAREEWERKHLTPAQERAQELESRVNILLNRRLEAEILEAAGPAVKEPFRKRQGKSSPLIAKMVADRFEYDPEHDAFFLKDGDDGFAFSSKPSGDAPYKSVSEFMEEFLADPSNKDLVNDQRPRGPGFGSPGGGSGSGEFTLTREEAKDPAKYRAAREAASKAGSTVQITD